MENLYIESPFSHGRPVSPDLFVGRQGEFEAILRYLSQCAGGRNENFFIRGPRGIGKSSFADYVAKFASRKFNFACLHVYLSGVTTPAEMSNTIFKQMLEQIDDKNLFERAKVFFSDYISGISAFGFGVQFTTDPKKLSYLWQNWASVLHSFWENVLKPDNKGLLLILDDINGLARNAQFASMLKSANDTIASRWWKEFPFFLILSGFPERWWEMVKANESVGRIFKVIDLNRLSNDEVIAFFKSAFKMHGIKVEDNSLALMVNYAYGLPASMHEIGDAVFNVNSDKSISDDDAVKGLKNAARNIGTRYIDHKIFRTLNSSRYRSILEKLPQIGPSFSSSEVRKLLSNSEYKVFQNFLRRARELGIILLGDKRGEYNFSDPMTWLYLRFLAEKKIKIN